MSIEELIYRQAFYHYYQPIFDIRTWKRIGSEVLLRSKLFAYPEDAFDVAKKEDRLYELDQYSIKQAIHYHQKSRYNTNRYQLFINVYPSTVVNPSFIPFIKDVISNQSINHQVVLELNESELISDYEKLKAEILILKKLGVLIAMDDVGVGRVELMNLIELEPDYIKMDKYFASGLEKSLEKQSIIKLFLDYCNQFDIGLILEGIETPVSLATAKSLGIHYGQGYATGRPELLEKY